MKKMDEPDRWEVHNLILVANSSLNDDEEMAVWRLVDAVGILSTYYPEAIGVAMPTGRGFKIIREER